MPIAFEWDLPEKLTNLLRVEPTAGVLRGREESTTSWLFSPDAERQYTFKVPVLISAVEVSEEAPSSAHEVMRQILCISGAGSTGRIVAEPQLLDFGTVLVGEEHRRHVTLINSSAVDLHYSLSFDLLSSDDPSTSDELESLISCDKLTGYVPARNTVNVQVTLTPDRRDRLSFAIMCALRAGPASDTGDESGQPLGSAFKLCEGVAKPDFPLLQIVDARLVGMDQVRTACEQFGNSSTRALIHAQPYKMWKVKWALSTCRLSRAFSRGRCGSNSTSISSTRSWPPSCRCRRR